MTKKFGIDAVESALNEQDRGKGKNAKVFLDNGDSMIIRIPSLETCASSYMAHSWFNEHDEKNSILPFACDKEKGEGNEDAFDKAAAYLLAAAKKRYNPETYVKGVSKPDPDFLFGKKLEPSLRMQFGFYNLADGKPVVIDLSKKHGEKIKEQIKKAGNKINQYAFELTCMGSRSNKDFSLTPYLDDLTQEQKQHFDVSSIPFDTSLYASSMYFKPEDKQLQDLTKIGFDVALIGYEKPNMANASANAQNQAVHNNPSDSVLPEDDIFNTSEIDDMLQQTGVEESA